jgi:hypothetical protein
MRYRLIILAPFKAVVAVADKVDFKTHHLRVVAVVVPVLMLVLLLVESLGRAPMER